MVRGLLSIIKNHKFKFIVLLAFALSPHIQARADTFDTPAHQAILLDADTGTVLFEKNADQKMPTSSMSKVLTAVVVYDAIKHGQLKLDDTLPVSEKAWRMSLNGGSTMFLTLNDRVKVEDLLHGVVIQSGNDACVVLAEGLAGSEDAFVDKMNRKAQDIGMKDSHFMNASGWPDPNHYSTARDLARLGYYLIKNYPDQYPNYSIKDFTYGKSLKGKDIKQGNRNPLLYANIGADGIKTGHTDEGGYGVMGSALQNGTRLILVMNGMANMKERAEESVKLMTWGFHEFGTTTVLKAGQTIDQIPVWLGQKASVPIVLDQDVKVTLPRRLLDQIKVSYIANEPVAAPVAKGATIAQLKITWPEQTQPLQIPLKAGEPVERLGPFQRIGAAARYLMMGH